MILVTGALFWWELASDQKVLGVCINWNCGVVQIVTVVYFI